MLISVIIPIYNASSTIDRCLSSIVDQTYKNIEIILVDDGSTDGSSEMCDLWRKKDGRIIVEHIKNGGASVARNIGLGKTNGDYVMFVDADDYLPIAAIESFASACKNKPDLIISNFAYSKNETIIPCKAITKKTMKVDRNKVYSLMLSYKYRIFTPWAKMIRKSLLDNRPFDESLKIGEDMDLFYRLVDISNNIILVPFVGYYYSQDGDSLTRTSISSNTFQRVDIIKKWRSFIIEKYPSVRSKADAYFFTELINLCIAIKNNNTFKNYYNEYRSLLSKKALKVMINCHISIRDKIKYLIA